MDAICVECEVHFPTETGFYGSELGPWASPGMTL